VLTITHGGGGRGERGNRPGPVGDLWGKVAGGVCFRGTGRVTEMPAGRACRAVGCWLLAAAAPWATSARPVGLPLRTQKTP